MYPGAGALFFTNPKRVNVLGKLKLTFIARVVSEPKLRTQDGISTVWL